MEGRTEYTRLSLDVRADQFYVNGKIVEFLCHKEHLDVKWLLNWTVNSMKGVHGQQAAPHEVLSRIAMLLGRTGPSDRFQVDHVPLNHRHLPRGMTLPPPCEAPFLRLSRQ